MFKNLKKGNIVLIKCGRGWFVRIVKKADKDTLICEYGQGPYFEGQFDAVKVITKEQMMNIMNKLLEVRERFEAFEAEVLPLDPIKSFEK